MTPAYDVVAGRLRTRRAGAGRPAGPRGDTRLLQDGPDGTPAGPLGDLSVFGAAVSPAGLPALVENLRDRLAPTA